MKRKSIFLIISGFMVLAPSLSHSGTEVYSSTTIPTKVTTAGIPGPRTCFWSKGPIGGDPYINIAIPDTNAFYWAASFSMPKGAKLELVGDFPYSRYMSIQSYNENGAPLDNATDYLIQPEKGSINPFITGNNRNAKNRKYSLEILNKQNPEKINFGRINEAGKMQVLYAPAYGEGQQTLVYRIYVPNKGKNITGGTNLPIPKLTLANGQQFIGEEACTKLNAGQKLQINMASATGITPIEYRNLAQQAGKPITWPAQNPSQWYILQDRKSISGIYTGDFGENSDGKMEGFYNNIDNQYIRTIVNRKFGKVYVMRGKAPIAPKTFNNDAVMKSGQLRYWSICSNQSFANTRVNDCLYDEEIPLDKNGNYTVVISRPEDRPRNAIPECGIAWLPMAKDGDGVFDEDVSAIYLRHMLAASDFNTTISRIKNQKEVAQVLGPYYPKTTYFMPNQVEAFISCSPKDGR
ncbi:hypothetical protein I6L25_09465 [Acinetobacter nosocomialis]|uniref:hypothetical protein n=1 Tax=Acinetobacter nosocomialis TaxID=106654 RepID=UPI0002CDFA7B|nr:hypothetical protein [Acinetobacter nosocomialis]ENU47268.1 hypothetical protein F984_01637 [Acinetobacter nosocomialis NIPH 2119]QXC10665.1 hypothetical protein I6L25_09465 [Acinetobacter nosocomialis]